MLRGSQLISKTKLREILIKKRKAIPQERREEASTLLKELLYPKGNILSFSPFGSEIDPTLLNESLKSENRLYLIPYEIECISSVPISKIDCILVPALGFDKENYRLGYGKGFYDRFLATFKGLPTIGVGFKEQLFEELLPRDPWDMPVDELLLL